MRDAPAVKEIAFAGRLSRTALAVMLATAACEGKREEAHAPAEGGEAGQPTATTTNATTATATETPSTTPTTTATASSSATSAMGATSADAATPPSAHHPVPPPHTIGIPAYGIAPSPHSPLLPK